MSQTKNMTLATSTLLALLRQDRSVRLEQLSPADWQELIDLSFEQGVDALSVDGYHKCLDSGTEESLLETDESLEDLKFEWFGSVLQAEEDSRRQQEAIASLAGAYSGAGIKTMVLKGYGLSLNWPNPLHRPTGDIDVYLFGDWKRGDELIRSRGIDVDEGHEHHTTFQWMDFTVENHYDFINTKVNGSSRELEREYKRLAEDAVLADSGGTAIYLPSAQFNALFLIRHLGQHFAGAEATLRQVLDWGFFVKACSREVDWKDAMRWYRRAGINKFVHQINAICVDYLGFEESIFPEIERDACLETRILEDILSPEFAEVKPQGSTLKVIWFKTRRFMANRWKHRLVYRESIPSQFFWGSIAHLRRFGTIKD